MNNMYLKLGWGSDVRPGILYSVSDIWARPIYDLKNNVMEKVIPVSGFIKNQMFEIEWGTR